MGHSSLLWGQLREFNDIAPKPWQIVNDFRFADLCRKENSHVTVVGHRHLQACLPYVASLSGTCSEKAQSSKHSKSTLHRCATLADSVLSGLLLPKQFSLNAGCRQLVYAVASSSGKEIVQPFNVVITGSTKGVSTTLPFRQATASVGRRSFAATIGIGKALATNFVRSGDNVVICSRSGIAASTAGLQWQPS